jgi:hypothetical protein
MRFGSGRHKRRALKLKVETESKGEGYRGGWLRMRTVPEASWNCQSYKNLFAHFCVALCMKKRHFFVRLSCHFLDIE